MLKTNDIEKRSAKSCKTVVILVTWYLQFTVQFCHVLLLHLLVELQYLNNRNTNKQEILHILLLACAQCHIFINPFTSCVTDRYQPRCLMHSDQTRKYGISESIMQASICNPYIPFLIYEIFHSLVEYMVYHNN